MGCGSIVPVPHKTDEKSGEQCRSNCTDPSPARFGQSWCLLTRIIGTGPPGKTPLEQPFHRPWCLRQGQRALRTLTQAGPGIVEPIDASDLSPAVSSRSPPPPSDSSESSSGPRNWNKRLPLEARIEGLILEDWNHQVDPTLGKPIDR